jgi:predicted AAA+ superfamily ATPase
MIQRNQLEIVKSRMNETRKFIQVLMGPRQVGKTTMMKQLTEEVLIDTISVSADGVINSNWLWIQQIWENARIQLKNSTNNELILIIDEIQKLDNWSEIVKEQWDFDTKENNNIKVILLGSSRLMIQKGLTESLAGRFEVTYVGHWSFSEMEEAFGWNVNQYIYYGAYPGAASLIQEEERWKNYIKDSLIETSISKDILMLTRVDKPAVLRRLFELGCLYSGQILAYTKLLGELQDAGNTTTLSHYLTLLSDSGLLGATEKYAGNVIRKRASKPKFQVFNNALLTAQDDLTYEKALSDSKIWGRLAESAIGAHLINNAITNNYTVYYWREKNDEVDFILERKNTLIALEVKTGRRAENNGMRVFAQAFKPKKVLLIGTGGIGIETFLRMNPGDLFN